MPKQPRDESDLFADLENSPPKEDGLGDEWNPKKHHYRDGHETSQEAAYQAEPTARAHEGIIVGTLRRHPELGCTINEIEAWLKEDGPALTYAQLSRRFSNLQRINAIYDTGLKRPTPSKRKAIVWKATFAAGEIPPKSSEP